MSLTFIPSVWAGRLLVALNKALVYAQTGVVNRDYEGEIRQAGDTVKIASIGDVTIGNYTKDTDISNPQALTDADQTLLINQAKYFNFAVDDIDRAQQNVNSMDEAMRRAAYGLSDVADQYIAASYSSVPSGNLLGSDGSPVVPSSSTAYEKLVDLSVLLDEANIPTEGRFVVVPSWFHGLLLKDDRFVKAGTTATDGVLRNGAVGEAAGFSVMKSNNVPNTAGTLYKIIAGHPMAYSYAEQITKVESYRKEKGFADGVKGLHVYGGKLVRPNAWAVLTASKS